MKNSTPPCTPLPPPPPPSKSIPGPSTLVKQRMKIYTKMNKLQLNYDLVKSKHAELKQKYDELSTK